MSTKAEPQSHPQGTGANQEPELPAATILDWMLSLPFFLVFLGVLLGFDLFIKLSARISQSAIEAVSRGLNAGVLLSLRVLGTRFEVHGNTNLSADRPYIINLQSSINV